MKNTFLAIAAIVILGGFTLGSDLLRAKDAPGETQEEPGVTETYRQALDKAAAENKRVLLDFSGSDWCHWCKVMEAEVFSTEEFKAYAKDHLVTLLVDFPARKILPEATARQNELLKNKFMIQGFPTFVVLSPDGRELDRVTGYLRGGPEAFIQRLRRTEPAR